DKIYQTINMDKIEYLNYDQNFALKMVQINKLVKQSCEDIQLFISQAINFLNMQDEDPENESDLESELQVFNKNYIFSQDENERESCYIPIYKKIYLNNKNRIRVEPDELFMLQKIQSIYEKIFNNNIVLIYRCIYDYENIHIYNSKCNYNGEKQKQIQGRMSNKKINDPQDLDSFEHPQGQNSKKVKIEEEQNQQISGQDFGCEISKKQIQNDHHSQMNKQSQQEEPITQSVNLPQSEALLGGAIVSNKIILHNSMSVNIFKSMPVSNIIPASNNMSVPNSMSIPNNISVSKSIPAFDNKPVPYSMSVSSIISASNSIYEPNNVPIPQNGIVTKIYPMLQRQNLFDYLCQIQKNLYERLDIFLKLSQKQYDFVISDYSNIKKDFNAFYEFFNQTFRETAQNYFQSKFGMQAMFNEALFNKLVDKIVIQQPYGCADLSKDYFIKYMLNPDHIQTHIQRFPKMVNSDLKHFATFATECNKLKKTVDYVVFNSDTVQQHQSFVPVLKLDDNLNLNEQLSISTKLIYFHQIGIEKFINEMQGFLRQDLNIQFSIYFSLVIIKKLFFACDFYGDPLEDTELQNFIESMKLFQQYYTGQEFNLQINRNHAPYLSNRQSNINKMEEDSFDYEKYKQQNMELFQNKKQKDLGKKNNDEEQKQIDSQMYKARIRDSNNVQDSQQGYHPEKQNTVRQMNIPFQLSNNTMLQKSINKIDKKSYELEY
ncbi:hypothetical protein TTHERM_01649030, partial (macronuclear) [Tetrahymena thermophila SB210]